MGMIDIIILVLLIALVIILWIFITRNTKLSNEKKQLLKLLETKNRTIENYEASHQYVHNMIENITALEDVMVLINSGESIESVSKELNIPLSNIELIIKFDKLKKRD